MAYVYLLHFDAPISPTHTAQHYLGYTDCLQRRIDAHRKGQAARLTQVAHERGITFQVARVWRNGTRSLERRLKNRKNHRRLCPICQQTQIRR